MTHPRTPSRLYKYRSLRTAEDVRNVCDTIANSRLYWPSPLSFNDPFDCVPAHVYEGSKAQHLANARRSAEVLGHGKPRGERRRMLATGRRRKPQEIVETLTAANLKWLEQAGVCSLTEARDNILMWSHYGDSHAGLCLGFEPSLDAIDLACAFPVIYAQDRPTINAMHRARGQEALEKVLLTKSSSWAYEREWRMINQRLHNRLVPYPPPALREIVFGARTTEANRRAILEAVASSGSDPELFETRPDPRAFAMNVIPLAQDIKRPDSPR